MFIFNLFNLTGLGWGGLMALMDSVILSLLKAAQAIQSDPSLKNASDDNMLSKYAKIYTELRNDEVTEFSKKFLQSAGVPLLRNVQNPSFLLPNIPRNSYSVSQSTPSSGDGDWLLNGSVA